jgi:hypothetical protein
VSTDPVRPTCTATTLAGKPCRAWAGPGGLCTQHNASLEQRALWAAQGAAATNFAKASRRLARKTEALSVVQATLEDASQVKLVLPDLTTQEAVEAYIARVVAEVHLGLLPPSKSRAIAELLDVKLKMVQMSISQRLLALEAELER